MKNLNTIIFNENGSIKSQTNNPIFAYAESQNVLKVYVPLSGYTVLGKFGKYAIVGGEKKVLLPERLYMKPKGQETIDGIPYNVYEQLIPSIVLSQAFVGQDLKVGFQLEAYKIEDEKYLGIKQYNTEATNEIVTELNNDFAQAEEDEFVRVVDTDTDWVFDGTTWNDTEEKLALGLERLQFAVIDYVVQGSFETDVPSHKPENTEFILSELNQKADLNAFLSALDDIDDLQFDKLEKDGSNADSDITIRATTFNLGADTDVIQQTDFAAYADGGASNLDDFLAYVEQTFLDFLSVNPDNFYLKSEVNALLNNKADDSDLTDHINDDTNPHQVTSDQVGAYSESEVDALLQNKAPLSHVNDTNNPHSVTAAQTGAYSTGQADTKFMAKETYLDANDKLLFSKLPDGAKSQTFVQTSGDAKPTENVLAGDKLYETDTGDSFIYDGTEWVVLAEADWENVSIDYSNLTNVPTEFNPTDHTHVKADITDFTHTHVEADITDLDKYTQQEVDDLLDDKADDSHTHVEADITDLDKYTQGEVDSLLADKLDVGVLASNIILYPTTTESDATTTESDVAGYNKLVTSPDDPDYDSTAVDVTTPTIDDSNVLVAELISEANLFVGNPGIINIPIVGQIRKSQANPDVTARFYFVRKWSLYRNR